MWDDARQMNALALTLAILSVLGLAVAGVTFIVRASAFAFNEVVVTGPLTRANAAHLEAVIRDDLDGTFFTLDLDRARATLAQVPWVRDVAIRRQWPDRLEITVEEHDPLARFNDGQFVSKRGDVFSAESRDLLPRFQGPEPRAAEMAQRFRAFGDALRSIGLQLTDVRLSARGGWRLRAEGGAGPLTLELGRDDPEGRLMRFVSAHGRTLGALERAGTKVDSVDLRYRNGFAARVPAFREKGVKPAA